MQLLRLVGRVVDAGGRWRTEQRHMIHWTSAYTSVSQNVGFCRKLRGSKSKIRDGSTVGTLLAHRTAVADFRFTSRLEP